MGSRGQVIHDVEEHLLQGAGQVTAPDEGRRCGQRMVLQVHPGHAAGIRGPRSDELGGAVDDGGRPGQDRGRPVPSRGERQGQRQGGPERRIGEPEPRVNRPHRRSPRVVRAGIGVARPVNDVHARQFRRADGAAARRGMGRRDPYLWLELAQDHHIQRGGQRLRSGRQPAQAGVGAPRADQRELRVQRRLEPDHVHFGGHGCRPQPGGGRDGHGLGQVGQYRHP